jgi:hypothetical protein
VPVNFRVFPSMVLLLVGVEVIVAAEPCVSGLKPGQKPGPYSAVICTGPKRGQSHCYICETAERPAIVVFARSLSEPLAKLVSKMDKALIDHKNVDLRGWMTILNDDQSSLDVQVVKWAAKHSIRNVPIGVFEDIIGPPSYRLGRDADVTVILFRKNKVTDNFAFRTGELDDRAKDQIMKAVERVVK